MSACLSECHKHPSVYDQLMTDSFMSNYINTSDSIFSVYITGHKLIFPCFFLSSLFKGGGVHSTMLNAVNPGLRPQTTEIQICSCLNYRISKTNNTSALDRDAAGKQTTSGLTDGYHHILMS